VALTERFLSAAAVWDGYSALRAALGTSPPPPAPVAAGDSDDDQELVMLAPPRSRELRDAWEITEALLATLAAEAMSHASEFWMTTLSVAEQTDPDVRKRAAVAAALGVDSLYYPDHRIREFARARAIPLVSLAEPLADYSARTGEFLNGGYNVDYPHGSGHWNATAHGLAARMVGERLCAQSPAFAGSR
jgi:hypothetical protein